MRIFIIAAIVLVVFAIIAAASTTMKCLGSAWPVWACASLLAFYTDLLLGGYVAGFITAHRQAPPQP